MRSQSKLAVLATAAAMLAGCQPASQSSVTQEEVAALKKELKSQSEVIQAMRGGLDAQQVQLGQLWTQVAAQPHWSSGVFDPAEPGFQRIDANPGVGSFAVMLEDVRQFGDGIRIRLDLGNLMGATIAGATLKLKYGPRAPNKVEDFSKWSDSLKTHDQAVPQNLLAGNWNPVNVVLPAIDQKQFGYLEVSISTSQVSLVRPRGSAQ